MACKHNMIYDIMVDEIFISFLTTLCFYLCMSWGNTEVDVLHKNMTFFFFFCVWKHMFRWEVHVHGVLWHHRLELFSLSDFISAQFHFLHNLLCIRSGLQSCETSFNRGIFHCRWVEVKLNSWLYPLNPAAMKKNEKTWLDRAPVYSIHVVLWPSQTFH